MAASIFCNRRLTYCTNVFWFMNVNSVHLVSIFCNRRLTYCTNVFWFMNVNSVHLKVLLMKFLELYQLLRAALYTKLFPIYSANFHYLVHHIEYRETTKRFRDRTTSLECLLGSRLLFFTDKSNNLSFQGRIKFTYWLIYGINLWKRDPSSANVLHNEFIPSIKMALVLILDCTKVFH